MPKLIVTTRDGSVMSLEGDAGLNAMEVIRNAGLGEMLALCGGCCCCATCHVQVDDEFSDRLPAMSETENELLNTSEHRTTTSRLACQVVLDKELDGLRLTIAPED